MAKKAAMERSGSGPGRLLTETCNMGGNGEPEEDQRRSTSTDQ